MGSRGKAHRTVALAAPLVFGLLVGGGYWQAMAYAPPPVHPPLHRTEDPSVGAPVKVPLPHPGEPFLLVDLGCGCEVAHLEPALLARRYGGLTLVFATNDPRDLSSAIERTDSESLRDALNPWFTPRVYGFGADGRLLYVQPRPDPGRGIAEPLKEARRALESR